MNVVFDINHTNNSDDFNILGMRRSWKGVYVSIDPCIGMLSLRRKFGGKNARERCVSRLAAAELSNLVSVPSIVECPQ